MIRRPTLALLALLALTACGGSGPSARATRVHEDARVAERLVPTRPGVAARRFAAAGEGIAEMARRHPGHPLTVELQEGDAVGDVPRALFEARLAVARQVVGRADLLGAAAGLLPPPRRGLGRIAAAAGPRPVDRLRAALEAAGRPIPEGVAAHGPPPTPRTRDADPLAALPALTDDPKLLRRRWADVRGRPASDLWLATALEKKQVPAAERFVWARALHRGRPWQALAAALIDEGDREGALRALGFAEQRGLLEGLAAPLYPPADWLPVRLARTLRAAGERDRAAALVALYAAGLARAFAVPGNGLDDLPGKARALAAEAVEIGDPVALAHLEQVTRTDLLGDLRRRARRPRGARDTLVHAARRLAELDPTSRADPALAAVRSMEPALAARAAVLTGERRGPAAEAARAALDTLAPPDRIVAALALAQLEPGEADAHLGAALMAVAELPDPGDRVDALVDIEAVRAALDRAPGPAFRAGLARVLFDATPAR